MDKSLSSLKSLIFSLPVQIPVLYLQNGMVHIEIQYNTYYDRQLHNWLHKYVYKRDYGNKIGCILRKEYEDGKIRTEKEFVEVQNHVLSDSKEI